MLIISESVGVDSWEHFRSLAARIIDEQQTVSDLNEVTCRKGCTACCNQLVPVGPSEIAALKAAIEELPADTRSRVDARITRTATRLRQHGFDTAAVAPVDAAERPELGRRYFEAQVPCPLLEDGACLVRDERPLVCREYLVTSDPVHCSTLDGEQIVRIRVTSDVRGSFGQAEYAAGRQSSYVLALALAEPTPELDQFESQSVASSIAQLMVESDH